MAIAVAGGGHRVDVIHLVAGPNERGTPQAAVGFDADHHLIGLLDALGQELMELADPAKSFG